MKRFLSVLFLVSALCAISLQAQGGPSARTEIPVKSVMLFSSGVGYFEHMGSVRGDAATELRFKTEQINDILKSLVLQDLDGGKVTTVTYPSQDPISKTLRSFQVDITSNPTMASLLNQLRGAKVTVQVQQEHLSGTILGVESRAKASDKGEAIEVPVLNLLAGAMIRSVELPAVTSLTLDDPQLQDELAKALQALSQARDQDKKPVTINFMGSGDRRVRIGYVVETPIWKTSYRLMLDDKTSRLQGWAIVENQTESDWNNVSLSLISGRPISFIMNLYQPLYLQRPTIVPDLFAGLTSQAYEQGLPVDRIQQALSLQPGAAGGGGRGGGATRLNDLVARDEVTTRQTISVAGGTTTANTVQSMARAAQLGELFQYTIPNVTLARQKSAMIPIVTDTVGIERLSIYNASVLPRNPLTGARLKNTTGKHLMQGPITVLDKNSYAGDARIDDVPPGQERLFSYGVDLDLLIDNTHNSQTNAVVTAKINKGSLILSRKLLASQEYLIDNRSTHEKTVIIEHPLRSGWKLVEPVKPLETTPTLDRFQTSASPGKITTFSVKEEIVRDETVSMLPSDPNQLITYSRTGEIPKDVRDAISKAIQLKQALLDVQQQIDTRTAQINDITAEQERIRENMKTVEAKSPYYERLLAKLNEQESTIERTQKERDDLMSKRDTQQKALEDYLNGLTVG